MVEDVKTTQLVLSADKKSTQAWAKHQKTYGQWKMKTSILAANRFYKKRKAPNKSSHKNSLKMQILTMISTKMDSVV